MENPTPRTDESDESFEWPELLNWIPRNEDRDRFNRESIGVDLNTWGPKRRIMSWRSGCEIELQIEPDPGVQAWMVASAGLGHPDVGLIRFAMKPHDDLLRTASRLAYKRAGGREISEDEESRALDIVREALFVTDFVSLAERRTAAAAWACFWIAAALAGGLKPRVWMRGFMDWYARAWATGTGGDAVGVEEQWCRGYRQAERMFAFYVRGVDDAQIDMTLTGFRGAR